MEKILEKILEYLKNNQEATIENQKELIAKRRKDVAERKKLNDEEENKSKWQNALLGGILSFGKGLASPVTDTAKSFWDKLKEAFMLTIGMGAITAFMNWWENNQESVSNFFSKIGKFLFWVGESFYNLWQGYRDGGMRGLFEAFFENWDGALLGIVSILAIASPFRAIGVAVGALRIAVAGLFAAGRFLGSVALAGAIGRGRGRIIKTLAAAVAVGVGLAPTGAFAGTGDGESLGETSIPTSAFETGTLERSPAEIGQVERESTLAATATGAFAGTGDGESLGETSIPNSAFETGTLERSAAEIEQAQQEFNNYENSINEIMYFEDGATQRELTPEDEEAIAQLRTLQNNLTTIYGENNLVSPPVADATPMEPVIPSPASIESMGETDLENFITYQTERLQNLIPLINHSSQNEEITEYRKMIEALNIAIEQAGERGLVVSENSVSTVESATEILTTRTRE